MRKLLTSLCTAAALFLSVSLAQAIDLKLTWSPNSESDLAGYRVYQATQAGGPYIKVGEALPSLTPGFSWPVPSDTESNEYFVVTAFDQAGNESGYSNEVSAYVDNKAPGVPGGIQIIIIVVPR